MRFARATIEEAEDLSTQPKKRSSKDHTSFGRKLAILWFHVWPLERCDHHEVLKHGMNKLADALEAEQQIVRSPESCGEVNSEHSSSCNLTDGTMLTLVKERGTET